MNKRNLKLKPSDLPPAIDWTAVDAAALADTPDDDSPELTKAQRKRLQPLAEILPMFSKGKTRITIMLDDAVLDAYKAQAAGRGYQTLINETLRYGLQINTVKDQLRQVIREELGPLVLPNR